MVRAPCCEKMGLKKGPWTPEEDQILISFVQNHGHGNWRALPKQAGLLRCGKSCRLRWINYLRPDIKRGNFTTEEEETIIKLHEMLGNRWSAIAAKLPGRTDNEIKNVWHTHLKKRLNKHGHIKNNHKSESKKVLSTKRRTTCTSEVTAKLGPPTSSTSDPQPSSSDFSSVTETTSIGIDDVKDENNREYKFSESAANFPEIDESFWSAALSVEISNATSIPSAFSYPFSPTSINSIKLDHDYCINTELGHDMDFWYDVFVKAGGSPELPEF